MVSALIPIGANADETANTTQGTTNGETNEDEEVDENDETNEDEEVDENDETNDDEEVDENDETNDDEEVDENDETNEDEEVDENDETNDDDEVDENTETIEDAEAGESDETEVVEETPIEVSISIKVDNVDYQITAAILYDEVDTNGYLVGDVLNAETGEILSGVSINLYQGEELVTTIETDEDGYYEVELSAGEYKVVIEEENFLPLIAYIEIERFSTYYLESF